MKLLSAVFLVLLIAICTQQGEGSKCKCSRKGPKIRFTDVQKLEIKPRHPHCEEKMIIVTMHVSRLRGQQYCLYPKLHSTKKFLKWYRIWKEKSRVYED